MSSLSPIALLLSLAVGACSSADVEAPASASDAPRATTRELLARSTNLFVSPTTSGGAITARRWSDKGWIAGEVPLVIDNGVVVAQADGPAGALSITTIDLLLAPIDLPYPSPGVAARLDRLKLDLAASPLVPEQTKWSTNDESATAHANASLILSWAVTVDNTTATLGPQHLPPIPVDLAFSGGDGKSVLATLTFDLPGTVWGWADLIELRDLRLVVDTASD